ncbi:MAG: hypothetical protein ACI399_08310 [Candidatus Cryptobacteroides sp.]
MKNRFLLLGLSALIALSCNDRLIVPAEVVNNDSPGVVNRSNVIASKVEYMYMLGLSAEDIVLNADGVPSRLLGCDIEYIPSTKADGQVVRVKDFCYGDSYTYDTFELTIGANGFANKCKETQADGEVTEWKFAYDSNGHLVYINYDGSTVNMKYDQSGNMISIQSKGDYEESVSFFYTSCPNYGWMPYKANYGQFPCRSFYLNGTDIFWVFYLAGFIGVPTADVPEYIIYRDAELSSEAEYYHHHLYRDDYGNGVYVLHDRWTLASGPQWDEYEPLIEDWRSF